MKKMLVIDTETGGLDPRTDAIISVACVVYNDAPEEFVHMVVNDPTGCKGIAPMAVHGITDERIQKHGHSPRYVVDHIINLLQRNQMYGKVTLAGHNLPFDVGFLRRLFWLAGEDFDKHFNHGGLDTKGLALALEAAGRIRLTSSSLVHVAPSFGVAPWKEHDALEDALATAKVLRKQLDMIAVR